jgi:hypothetical protein
VEYFEEAQTGRLRDVQVNGTRHLGFSDIALWINLLVQHAILDQTWIGPSDGVRVMHLVNSVLRVLWVGEREGVGKGERVDRTGFRVLCVDGKRSISDNCWHIRLAKQLSTPILTPSKKPLHPPQSPSSLPTPLLSLQAPLNQRPPEQSSHHPQSS